MRSGIIETLQAELEKLRLSIDELEAQRGRMGDEAINTALAALRTQLAILERQNSPQVAPAEERSIITILFMDMVGSTFMAEKMDPEEWRQVIVKLQTILGEAVSACHGFVVQYLGDGLLALFGIKESSEVDSENAIRAALQSQTIVTSLLSEQNVQIRAGIHTGLVVTGELGYTDHKEFTASGDALNLAARLQSSAPPGGVLISHDTYRYVRGVFNLTPQPPLLVKGKSEPLQTYLVRSAKTRPFRSVARGVAGIETHTFGREAELQALKDAYLRAFEGHGMVWAQLLGDPGVGKSRLLSDISDWMDLREETYWLLRGRSFPDDTNQPFSLVRRMWFDRFQIADDTPLEIVEAKWVERIIEFSGQDDWEEAAHALGLLVGLPFKNSPYIKAMRNDPTQVKGRALVVSRELVNSVRQKYHLVVLLEDLQWADAASWEYLVEVFLGEEAGKNPNGLFLLGAARPEWRPPEELVELFDTSMNPETTGNRWGVQISLPPLTNQAIHQLAMDLLQRVEDVPEQIVGLLVKRSEGVPYFVEEMVNWFIDRGILVTRGDHWQFLLEKLHEQPLPATLQHLLLTRLSSLSLTGRATLQRGAIFGRQFWTGGVEALGVKDATDTLGRLKPGGFIEIEPESKFQGETEWSFHHNLLQEVTYESILKRERAALHMMAAGWLENQARQAGRLSELAGRLGEHYERAGEFNVAAEWYLNAGGSAFSQGAPHEATIFYSRALDLFPTGELEKRWRALSGRVAALYILGEAEPWRADISALGELAGFFNDDHYLAEAALQKAKFMLNVGEPVNDRAAQEALKYAKRCKNESIVASALSIIAMIDGDRGDRRAAIGHIKEAMRSARRISNESVLALVLFRAAYCYIALGDFARAEVLQIEQIELDHKLGDHSQEAHGLVNLGLGYSSIGQFERALKTLEQASPLAKALGARRILAYVFMNLADIYLPVGDLQNAHHYAELAMLEITPSQDIRGEVSILNTLGMVSLAMGDEQAAFNYFREALDLALSQDLIPIACETESGLAACCLALGRADEAREYAHRAWNYLKEYGWAGMNKPIFAYRACAETLNALGDYGTSRAVLKSGYQTLMEQAGMINKPSWKQSFLENVPDNRAIMEMWERRSL